ncbi:MAG: hypothetical protein IAF00_08545 [Phycisphaerales bacterium]|nr:hypothetical protein [Phycisphaerales bacterium]
MKPWINEETIKTWTDAQRRLWESLCSTVPFQPPAGVEAWRETYLHNLTSWESVVKQTLAQEAAWVEQWVRRIAHEKGTPEVMASWVRQMEEVLQRWIQSQNQWWDEYFAVLRRGGLAKPDQMGDEMAAAVKSVGESLEAVVVPKKAAETISEPPTVSVASAAPMPPAPATVEAPVMVPTDLSPDDFKCIKGIGPALEKKLNACGVQSYRQLATLSDAEIERIEAVIKSAGRIRRDDWIAQAKEYHFQKYQEKL